MNDRRLIYCGGQKKKELALIINLQALVRRLAHKFRTHGRLVASVYHES